MTVIFYIFNYDKFWGLYMLLGLNKHIYSRKRKCAVIYFLLLYHYYLLLSILFLTNNLISYMYSSVLSQLFWNVNTNCLTIYCIQYYFLLITINMIYCITISITNTKTRKRYYLLALDCPEVSVQLKCGDL